jgi:hypothetical protein
MGSLRFGFKEERRGNIPCRPARLIDLNDLRDFKDLIELARP